MSDPEKAITTSQSIQPVIEPDVTPAAKPRNGWKKAFFTLLAFDIAVLLGVGAYFLIQKLGKDDDTTAFVTPLLTETANKYEELGEFYDGVAQVKRDGAIYYISTSGDIVEPPEIARSGPHHPDRTDLVRFESSGKWGMKNVNTNDTVIQPIYSTLGHFHNGLALASKKFGEPSMPEYVCIYGYVDTRGNSTFIPAHDKTLKDAEAAYEHRLYLESLPKGVTVKTLGLPDGVANVVVVRDSLMYWEMKFNSDGIMSGYRHHNSLYPEYRYTVSDGLVNTLTCETPDSIYRYRFIMEHVDDNTDNIIRVGHGKRTHAGRVSYSPEDHTVIDWMFDELPSLKDAEVITRDDLDRPTDLRIQAKTFFHDDFMIQVRYR